MVQSILITRGDPWVVLNHPIAVALLVLSIVSIFYLGPKRKPKKVAEAID